MESRSNRPVALTLRVYRALAAAFPHEFRNLYGTELMQTADDSAEMLWREQGIPGLMRLLLDLSLRLLLEYLSEIRQDLRYGFRMLGIRCCCLDLP